ncbi:SDR family NAD(P)-dependent oxidoreductase [Glaciibacter sp. 2TAF33]|uniref:SDR family NAD(P)-dependent oxidoreductase n=1 Tax=Glaciibacter sp. 2TAF33 TaxID=3233015 RepID=UPI003F903699
MAHRLDKTIVITGASSGIGRAAAAELAERGARVAVVGRNPQRTAAVAASIGGTAFLADFARFDDVRPLADALLARYETIDVLANNAGGLVSRRTDTADGHEQTIQVNHLSPFLLTSLLLPRLVETASAGRPVRVISTASAANRMGQLRLDDLHWRGRRWLGGWRAYGSAKVATILFTRELARRTAGTGVDAYAFHPGFVTTGFGADSRLMKLAGMVGFGGYALTPEAGAAPLVELASAERLSLPSGTYFDGLRANGRTTRQAGDDAVASGLWNLSERLVSQPSRIR